MRLVTFNIQHGRTAAGRVDVGVLRHACQTLDADVLGLQEADVGTDRVGGADLVGEVGQACAMAAAFGPAMARRPGEYGNALLARGDVDDTELVLLPRWPGVEPRSALLASLALTAGPRLSVAVCHLGLGRTGPAGEAEAQLAAAVARLEERPRPRVVLGDFNLAPHRAAPLVEAGGLTLAGGPPTFPAHRPRRRIDHVAVAGLVVTTVSTPHLPLSDHRPLVVEVELDDQERAR